MKARIVAVVERDGWYAVIRSNGDRDNYRRADVVMTLARDGLSLGSPAKPLSDGRVSWPLLPVKQGVAA